MEIVREGCGCVRGGQPMEEGGGSAREFIGREVFASTQAVPWNNVRRKRRADTDMKRVFGDREASEYQRSTSCMGPVCACAIAPSETVG